MSEERTEWLKNLKPGDKFYLSGRFGGLGTIGRVDRRTPSGRIYAGAMEFNPDGRTRGGSGHWDYRTIEPVTPKIREEVERRALVSRLQHDTKWHKLDTATLRKVAALVAPVSSGG